MSTISFTESLKNEYENLYKTMEIRIDKLPSVEAAVDSILQNKNRYKTVGNSLNIPWYFIAIIHSMESTRNFTKHLHNGDSLTARTKQVPKGRPLTGNPPFTWEESAEDALKMKNLHTITDWSLEQTLYQFERYNGWGYRLYHQHVKSPYLWSYSNQYTKGKYVADGTWSDTAVSLQVGAVVLLKRLEERGEIPIFYPSNSNKPIFKYSNNVVPRADDLQRFLNTFDGISLLTDGKPGQKTSNAVKKLFGFKLDGAPE